MQRIYPAAHLLKPGTRVYHLDYGEAVVSRKSKKSELPYGVWIKLPDGIEGTCDIRVLRWPD